jgi:hypothetical protein
MSSSNVIDPLKQQCEPTFRRLVPSRKRPPVAAGFDFIDIKEGPLNQDREYGSVG